MMTTRQAPLRGAGESVRDELSVGDEVWVGLQGTAEEWNLGVIEGIRGGWYQVRIKCNNRIKKIRRKDLRSKAEHTEAICRKSVSEGTPNTPVYSEFNKAPIVFNAQAPVIVSELGGDKDVPCIFLEASPNGDLVSVMHGQNKTKHTMPSGKVRPALSAPPAEDCKKTMLDDAVEKYVAELQDSGAIPCHPLDRPEVKKVMKDFPELFRSEVELGKMRYDFYEAQKKEEEPVDIYAEIDWNSSTAPICEHPSGRIFAPLSYPMSYTEEGYVLKGYLFRKNLPHIEKDQVRECPYFFDEDGRVRYAADAAVFTKLGEVK